MTAEFGLTAKEKLKMKVTDEMVNRFLAWKLPADFLATATRLTWMILGRFSR